MPAKWEDGYGVQSLQATNVLESSASWSAENKWALSQCANLNHSWIAHHSTTRAPFKSQVLWNIQVFLTLRVNWSWIFQPFGLFFFNSHSTYVLRLQLDYWHGEQLLHQHVRKNLPHQSGAKSRTQHFVRPRIQRPATLHCAGCELWGHCNSRCDHLFVVVDFFFSPHFPVRARRGEGCLPAAPDHGVRWSVVFCSQRQLPRHRQVTQRLVSVNINLLIVVHCIVFNSIFISIYI